MGLALCFTPLFLVLQDLYELNQVKDMEKGEGIEFDRRD